MMSRCMGSFYSGNRQHRPMPYQSVETRSTLWCETGTIEVISGFLDTQMWSYLQFSCLQILYMYFILSHARLNCKPVAKATLHQIK